MIKTTRNIVLGIAVAICILLALEGILWISGVEPLYKRTDPFLGFAGYSPLFLEKNTPEGERVYATANNKMDWFNYQQFPVQKGSRVTRIFCLGGSTTYGRPYDDRTSFCGWLREFLPAADSGRQWEVINAGGISYASYRVLNLMESLVQYEPDLFIIYTGHNEFLEKRTYERMFRTPEFLRNLSSLASRLRIYSLLSDIVQPKKDLLMTDVEALMDKSVGPEDYHRDDKMRDAVLEHFRISLNNMSLLGQKAGAEIIFVTPASNIRNFSPFKSEPATGLDSADIQQIDLLKKSIYEHLNNQDTVKAADLVIQSLAIDPRDAELLYLKGRAMLALGKTDEARQAFIAARDEDIAPLRALSPIPGIISDVALEKDGGLVDFASMIEELSPNGIPGEEHFLDHVHPTIDANRLMALAIVDEMIRHETISPASTWNDTAISAITDQVLGKVDDAANATALTNLSRVLTWAGKQEEALRLVERASSITSDHHTISQRVTVLVRTDRWEEALPYSEQSVLLMPEIADVRRTHGIILAQLGRNTEALQELEIAAQLDPTMEDLYYHLGLVLSKLGHTDRAEGAYQKAIELEPESADAMNNLGTIYAQRGDLKEAGNLFERAIEADPGHLNARNNLERVKRMLSK